LPPPHRPPVPRTKIASGAAAAKNFDITSEERNLEAMGEGTLSKEKDAAEVRALHEKNSDTAANRTLRETYANRVFYYLVSYTVSIFLFVLFSGAKFLMIENSVLLTMVGSTAVAAIGLVGIVVKGLFGGNNGSR